MLKYGKNCAGISCAAMERNATCFYPYSKQSPLPRIWVQVHLVDNLHSVQQTPARYRCTLNLFGKPKMSEAGKPERAAQLRSDSSTPSPQSMEHVFNRLAISLIHLTASLR
ncbi:hypothetical protein CEXT_346001 [Caerostris extrusa]|uniref:Uncharacterized protein n=1 Tax=Caerostris extrusa TaxID=172846 RepID=A0AAV4Y063_CAEEX|nr:hypothetical protein CEXT_346001 [Caerostris extrusa]